MTAHGLSLTDRIMARVVVDESTGCWLWQGSTSNGYGTMRVGGKNGTTVKVHRVAYQEFIGPIPDETEIDHVRDRGCVHRHCCNPAHLEAVTHAENVLRGEGVAARHARQTHCLRGHAFNETNTYWRVRNGRDVRECRACWAVR